MEMLYIKVFFDDIDAMDTLTDAERGRLLSAMLRYAADGETPKLGRVESALFAVFSKRIDRERVSMEQLSEKRSEAGKLGGRPRRAAKEQPDATETAPSADGEENTFTGVQEENRSEKAFAFPEKQKKLKGEKERKNKKENKTAEINTDTDPRGRGRVCTRRDMSNCEEDGEAYEAVYELFNSVCADLPKVLSGTPERERELDRLFAGTGGSLDRFRKVFEKAAASDFLCGRTASGNGWRATFDWLISENNWLRVLEGSYDNRPGGYEVSSASARGVYEPTYDIGKIERLLDEEWERQFAD